MDIQDYKCDDCNSPATHAVRNYVEVEPIDGIDAHEQDGPLEFGCDNHKKISKIKERIGD